jgi:hypothetical protein
MNGETLRPLAPLLVEPRRQPRPKNDEDHDRRDNDGWNRPLTRRRPVVSTAGRRTHASGRPTVRAGRMWPTGVLR